MTDQNDQTDKTLRAGARKPLTLQKTVESGHVRQNFSHGRNKMVVVEKKKTRKLGGESAVEPPAVPVSTVAQKPKPVAAPRAPEAQAATETRSGGQARILSKEEHAARASALAAARAEDLARPVEVVPERPAAIEAAPAAEAIAPSAPVAAAQPATAAPAPAAAQPAPTHTPAPSAAPTPAPSARPPYNRDDASRGP
ncbi:MAG TPA: translation initiation factor IF-2 associated domain-containing protein, partial [Hyphomicrobium sp.]|nr:translation initiation factor IF-2 associated domain-containing protein [Hyphomicrobium sp.]